MDDALHQLELVGRLAIALLLAAAVGWERELQRQPAGFRTHALVGLGAATFMVVSGEAFHGPGTDPTRIAAQIVTGIGFIGAGAILRHEGNVRGLTTAASLWTVAAVGMAAGASLYILAVGGTVLAIVALELMDRLEKSMKRRIAARTEHGAPSEDAADPTP